MCVSVYRGSVPCAESAHVCTCPSACVFSALSHRRPSFATSKYLPIILGVWIHLHLKPTERAKASGRRREEESRKGGERDADTRWEKLWPCATQNVISSVSRLCVCVCVCVCVCEQADMTHFPDCLFCLLPPRPRSLSSSLSLPLHLLFFSLSLSFGALRKALAGLPK